MNEMIIIWLSVVVVTVVIEALSVQLLCIWFSIAALVSMILAIVGAPLWLQILVFAVCTILLLILTRPFVKRVVKKSPIVSTNADRVIGKEAVVIREINNDEAEGQVKVMNQIWTARSISGDTIPADEKVVVRSIDGVKLMVEKT